MTTQGISGPLPATQPIEAWRACLLHGQVRTAAEGPTESDPTVRERLTLIHLDDWAAYKYVDFEAQPVHTFQAPRRQPGLRRHDRNPPRPARRCS